jgi:hypothetical protein
VRLTQQKRRNTKQRMMMSGKRDPGPTDRKEERVWEEKKGQESKQDVDSEGSKEGKDTTRKEDLAGKLRLLLSASLSSCHQRRVTFLSSSSGEKE